MPLPPRDRERDTISHYLWLLAPIGALYIMMLHAPSILTAPTFLVIQLLLQHECNYEQCIKLVQVHENWSNQFHYLQMFEHTHIVPTRHSCCFLMLCTFRFVFCISIVLCVLDEQLHHIERYANVEFIAFCCYLLVYNFMIVCVFVDLFLNVNFHEVECEPLKTKLSNLRQVSV